MLTVRSETRFYSTILRIAQVIDFSSKDSSTVAGAGAPGFLDGKGKGAKFSEPGGLANGPTSSTVFVCDTNNNAIR